MGILKSRVSVFPANLNCNNFRSDKKLLFATLCACCCTTLEYSACYSNILYYTEPQCTVSQGHSNQRDRDLAPQYFSIVIWHISHLYLANHQTGANSPTVAVMVFRTALRMGTLHQGLSKHQELCFTPVTKVEKLNETFCNLFGAI